MNKLCDRYGSKKGRIGKVKIPFRFKFGLWKFRNFYRIWPRNNRRKCWSTTQSVAQKNYQKRQRYQSESVRWDFGWEILDQIFWEINCRQTFHPLIFYSSFLRNLFASCCNFRTHFGGQWGAQLISGAIINCLASILSKGIYTYCRHRWQTGTGSS